MNLIRVLYFFIHLTVLVLFVLQRVDADAECEIRLERVEQIFFEAFDNTVNEFLINYYFDAVKNGPGNLDIMKLNLVIHIKRNLQHEEYLHLLQHDSLMTTSFKQKIQEDLEKAWSFDNTENEKSLNEMCTEFARSCLNKDIPEGHNFEEQQEHYFFEIHLQLQRELSLKDKVFLNFFQHHPLLPCFSSEDNDENIKFFFTKLNINSKLNLFLFRMLANEKQVEVFAVTSHEIEE